MNVRKVGKDCLISYSGNFYSVPSEYADKYVTLVVLDNTLAAYYDGKRVALHVLSTQKKIMIVSKHHYQKLLGKQKFDTENTLLSNRQSVDFAPFEIDLEVYDV
jgi:hypothetical protein